MNNETTPGARRKSAPGPIRTSTIAIHRADAEQIATGLRAMHSWFAGQVKWHQDFEAGLKREPDPETVEMTFRRVERDRFLEVLGEAAQLFDSIVPEGRETVP